MSKQAIRAHKGIYYLVNGITAYRLIAAPVLIVLIFTGKVDIFKWLLAFSFFTDMIDGHIARRYKVTSVAGARLDSIADDLTVLAAIIGLLVLKTVFMRQQIVVVVLLLCLYIIQNASALIKYHKTTSFHTYTAKVAAVFQGVFLILVFFLTNPPEFLFYAAVLTTAVDLIEETILVFILSKWQADVKGIYWLKKGILKDN